MCFYPATRDYLRRGLSGGKTNREIRRSLTRLRLPLHVSATPGHHSLQCHEVVHWIVDESSKSQALRRISRTTGTSGVKVVSLQ
jgi:hypothetical protein